MPGEKADDQCLVVSFPFATVLSSLSVLASSLAGAMITGQRPSTTWSLSSRSPLVISIGTTLGKTS